MPPAYLLLLLLLQSLALQNFLHVSLDGFFSEASAQRMILFCNSRQPGFLFVKLLDRLFQLIDAFDRRSVLLLQTLVFVLQIQIPAKYISQDTNDLVKDRHGFFLAVGLGRLQPVRRREYLLGIVGEGAGKLFDLLHFRDKMLHTLLRCIGFLCGCLFLLGELFQFFLCNLRC